MNKLNKALSNNYFHKYANVEFEFIDESRSCTTLVLGFGISQLQLDLHI